MNEEIEEHPVLWFKLKILSVFWFSVPAKRLRKVKTTVEALYFEKTKAEKVATKGSAGGKGLKSKVKLNVEGDRAILKGGLDDGLDDFDDFM